MKQYYINRQCSLIIILLISISCNKKPQPIDYGVDGCQFCKMTIVDKIHGAELITKKGKVYKFDATECMINYIKDIDTTMISLYLTNYYENPENLIHVEDAVFMINTNLPSPMGAYLTAFESIENTKKIEHANSSKLFSWKELLNHLK